MKKHKKTIEELNEERLDFELKQLRERYTPEPNANIVPFKVGDQVQLGHLKNSIITECLDNGKIYKVTSIATNNNYGKPYDSVSTMYVPWMRLKPYKTPSQNFEISIFSVKDDFRLSFSQRNVEGLLSMTYDFGIDLNPDYQRGSVWTLEDKVFLINSIFNRIDIGKFAIIRLPFKSRSPSYEMLDGKQRLEALMDFYEGKFSFKGKFFRDLNHLDQHVFIDHPITIGECEDLSQKQKYEYFLRLNVRGKPQDPNHIQKVQDLLNQLEDNSSIKD